MDYKNTKIGRYALLRKALGRIGRALCKHGRSGVSWLLLITILVQVSAPVLARADSPAASPQIMANQAFAPQHKPTLLSKLRLLDTPVGLDDVDAIKFYEQTDVDCANPQYPPVELPFLFHQDGVTGPLGHHKWLYMCSDGATVHLKLKAKATGKNTYSYYKLRCREGTECDGQFDNLFMSDNGGSCSIAQSLFDYDIYLPPGKYDLLLTTKNAWPDVACPLDVYYEYEVDVNPPKTDLDMRMLAKENPCLTNNPNDLGFVGDPVSTYNGNFTYSVQDVSLPALGLPLHFERTYNSLDSDSDGPLGYGWTHSYNMSLSFKGDEAILKAPRGSRLTFSRQGDGSFVPGPGVRASLVEDGDGYRLTRADQIVYLFDQQGQLTALLDNNGNQTTLQYVSEGVDGSKGRLIRVTAPGDLFTPRELLLSYNDQGRLVSLTAGGQTVHYGYSIAGNLDSVTDRRGFKTSYSYYYSERNPLHLLRTIDDPNGNSLEMTYDDKNRVSSQTDAEGHSVGYAYQEGMTIFTDAEGADTRYYYDGALLTAIVNPLLEQTTFGYDQDFNRSRVTDALGRPSYFEWNPNSCKVSHAIDALGNETHFDYDEHNNLTLMTDALKRSSEFAYDERDNLVAIINALKQKTHMDYDSAGQLIKLTNARRFETNFKYNFDGDLLSVQDALKNETYFQYDPATGDLTAIRDANDHWTWFVYDTESNLTRVMDHLYNTVEYSYGPAGELLSVTDQRDNTTSYKYDGLYQVIRITDASGEQTILDYDKNGNLVRVTDPNHNSITMNYDQANRLTDITDHLGNTVHYDLDAVGNLVIFTDPNNNTTTFQYDALNRLTDVFDPLNQVTHYKYDEVSNLSALTNAHGHTTDYVYDDLNRLWQVTDPLRRSVGYRHDEMGNLSQLIKADGSQIDYVYDELDRLTHINYPPSPWNHDVVLSYDAVGNLLTMSDGQGVTSYAYDELDRLTNVLDPQNRQVNYTYDAASNRLTTNYEPIWGSPVSIGYQYDKLNRLEQVSAPDMSGPIQYVYDPAGRLKQVIVPDASHFVSHLTNYEYDRADRLTRLENQVSTMFGIFSVSAFEYDYDAAGNRTWTHEEQDDKPARKIGYSYDELHRLTGVNDSQAGQSSYTYDAVGNRLSEVSPGGAIDYSYDVADQLLKAGDVGYGWDANGNLLGAGALSYTYDAEDRLVAFDDGVNSGERSYTGDGLLYRSFDPGQTTRDYVWDVNASLPLLLVEDEWNLYMPDSVNVYGLGLEAQLETFISAVIYQTRYTRDGLGSVREELNPDGSLVERYRYTAFGEQLSGSVGDGMRFAGEQYDAGLELYYLRARWYDPSVGRFMTQDPFPGLLAQPQTLNPYVYVVNNPVNLTDPSGEFPWSIVIGAGVGGAMNVGQYLLSPGQHTFRGAVNSAAKGAFIGGAAGVIGLGAGKLAVWKFGGGAIVEGIVGGIVSSSTSQVAYNILDPCVDWYHDLHIAARKGAVTGAIGVVGKWVLRAPAPGSGPYHSASKSLDYATFINTMRRGH